jgi:hypothetical protein
VTKLGDAKEVNDGYDLEIREDFDAEEDTLGEGL